MILTAEFVFLFCCTLGVFWLLKRDMIRQTVFFWLFVVLMIALLVIRMGPDILEVNISGHTLKALRQENDRAREALSAFRKLRSDMLSMEFKRIAISDLSFAVPGDAVKAEEFDQFLFVLDILPNKEEVDVVLLENVTKACEAVLSRQHLITGMHFVFSESGFAQGGGFSRTGLLPHEGNFRTLTSEEIKSELDELHRIIENTPGQSLANDKNREFRLEAVENYKQISVVCSQLRGG